MGSDDGYVHFELHRNRQHSKIEWLAKLADTAGKCINILDKVRTQVLQLNEYIFKVNHDNVMFSN